MTAEAVTEMVTACQQRVEALDAALERALDDRACMFAAAQIHAGMSAGEIARLTDLRPERVAYAIKLGRGLLCRTSNRGRLDLPPTKGVLTSRTIPSNESIVERLGKRTAPGAGQTWARLTVHPGGAG